MSFWIFGRKREEHKKVRPIEPSVNEKKEITESDLQFLIDYFYNISRRLSKIEHAASANPRQVDEIKKDFDAFRKVIQKLNRSEPDFNAYWNNLFNIMDDYVYSIKKILPESIYDVALSHDKIERLGRYTRTSTSEFLVLLEDVKKKLGKKYKGEFNVSWPKKSSFF